MKDYTQKEQKTIEQALAIMESKMVDYGIEYSNPDSVKNFLKLKLANRKKEWFGVMYLNSRHQLIKYEEPFSGTIDGASVYPRIVVKDALKHNAAAVIFAHNHPSGCAEPSSADRGITDRLVEALKLIDVRTLDHIVVGGSNAVSFAERGYI